ncbi:hypothetical protein Lalb_Chr11g0065941 [Lupinus albus]|uniref:Uncharacterized protein n=1 Tax=Lupinus albus TaxID=3870 RepID=A0A6A4PQH9_LUPAL|nr:hypothetical protein Lalb_Chr11g0065941 [Lupinus albus]
MGFSLFPMVLKSHELHIKGSLKNNPTEIHFVVVVETRTAYTSSFIDKINIYASFFNINEEYHYYFHKDDIIILIASCVFL